MRGRSRCARTWRRAPTALPPPRSRRGWRVSPGIDEREHILPDPAVLWLKAKLLQSSAAVERAALPITRLQIAAYLIIAACWAALLTWKSAALQLWINHFSPGHMILGAAGAEAGVPLAQRALRRSSPSAPRPSGVAMHTILAEE